MLKKLFSRQPELELLGYDEGLLTVRSSRALALGELEGDFRLAGLGRLKARVDVLRPLESGCYQAVLVSPREAEEHLATLLPALGLPGRRAPRLESSFRVVSPDLPGYRALAVDLSVTGIGLAGLATPLEEGARLHLKLELDSFREPVRTEATVRWCRPGRTGWRVGASFGVLGTHARQELEEHLGELRSIERGVVPSSLSA